MVVLKLMLIWLLVLLSGAGVCYLMGQTVLQRGENGQERG
jgi:hypothetical protein